MADIQNYLTPKIDRGGIKYRFSWLNINTQPNFTKLIELDVSTVPRVVLVNPGKRKKYFIMEEDITESDLSIIKIKLYRSIIRKIIWRRSKIQIN